MKIVSTEIYRYKIPMVPFEIATGRMDYAQNVLIKIKTDMGFEGIGECSAFPMIVGETQETCLVLARDFATIWKSKDPLNIEQRLAELDHYIAANHTIKSAFDMALYDIAAKHSKLPLYKYLGGQIREIYSDITVGLGTPEQMATTAKEFQNNGAHVLKVKLGKTPDKDIERIAAIRETIGYALPIRIDANQGWSYEAACKALKGLERYQIEFCEQPMRRFDDAYLPALRKETAIPIMADESCYDAHDVERLAQMDACDYINIKLAKSGGILEALKIAKTAAKYEIPCMMGGMLESRVALSAMVHFVMANPNIVFYDLDTCLLGHLVDPVEGGVTFDKYQLFLPSEPGIGADVQPDFLKDCEKWIL